METRDYKTSVEVRANPETGRPMIVGYGIVFNSDSENLGGFIEQVDPGAVSKTLSESDIRGIANHNSDWTLGRVKAGTMRLRADSRGVLYEIDVNPTDPDGQRALAKVERGDWDGSSFCFETLQESWDWDAQPARRRLLEIKLIEMGPVAFPAYPDSTATARAALSRIAKKLGHPVERMVEALKNGEIRSLIDKPGDSGVEEAKALADSYTSSNMSTGTSLNIDFVASAEERVGKKLSAASLAKIQRAIEELNALMGEMDPAEMEPDSDPDDERALEDDQEIAAVSMDRARALVRLRQAEQEQLEQRYAA